MMMVEAKAALCDIDWAIIVLIKTAQLDDIQVV